MFFNKLFINAKNEQNSVVKNKNYSIIISNFLFYLLAFILSYQGANIFWNSIPYKNQVIAGLSESELKQIRSPRNQVSPDKYSLFGKEVVVENSKENEIQVETKSGKVVKSSLNIVITGISASTEQGKGSVVMTYNGVEDVYGVGDDIKKTKAKVKEIHPDRIVITNNGRDEVVMLPGEEFIPQRKESKINSAIENSDLKNDKEQLQMVRTELLSNPGTLFNYISINPKIENGKTIGYELNPGTDDRLFINAGLRAGDIALEINGMDLTNNAQAMAALSSLQDATSITLVIDRNGSRETITLDLQ